MITDDEARKLALAMQNVMAFHSINVNPQILAYVQLVAIAATIYGPRLMLIAAQKKQQQARGPIPESPMKVQAPAQAPQQAAPQRPYTPADPTQIPIPVGPMRFQ